MRIDKYLKVTRIIKRRTVAKDIVSAERIYVNDRLVKPSYQLKIGDIITICFGNKKVVVPGKTLIEVSKILPGDTDKDVNIYFTDKHTLSSKTDPKTRNRNC